MYARFALKGRTPGFSDSGIDGIVPPLRSHASLCRAENKNATRFLQKQTAAFRGCVFQFIRYDAMLPMRTGRQDPTRSEEQNIYRCVKPGTDDQIGVGVAQSHTEGESPICVRNHTRFGCVEPTKVMPQHRAGKPPLADESSNPHHHPTRRCCTGAPHAAFPRSSTMRKENGTSMRVSLPLVFPGPQDPEHARRREK